MHFCIVFFKKIFKCVSKDHRFDSTSQGEQVALFKEIEPKYLTKWVKIVLFHHNICYFKKKHNSDEISQDTGLNQHASVCIQKLTLLYSTLSYLNQSDNHLDVQQIFPQT